MKITKFSIIVPLVCAVVGSDNVCAQDTADGSAVCTVGSLELISTGSSPEVFRIIEEARPDEPNAVPVPKFTLRTRDNKFMLSIGGKINPIMGYDIGNNLYNVDGAGSNFIPGDIPVPALQGHKGDFFINALNGDVDFTMAGLGGTPNRITGYIKIGTDGISKGIKLKRAYITYRRVTAGLRHSTATDNEALQPNTIDPQGPNGDFCTTNYQLAYNSPSYSGFSWAAAIEMPSFCNSNGIYRGRGCCKTKILEFQCALQSLHGVNKRENAPIMEVLQHPRMARRSMPMSTSLSPTCPPGCNMSSATTTACVSPACFAVSHIRTWSTVRVRPCWVGEPWFQAISRSGNRWCSISRQSMAKA